MITQDDIAAMGPASEFVRRAEKGIPPDRWVDGVEGTVALVKAVMAMQRIIIAQGAGLEAAGALLTDIDSRTSDGLQPSAVAKRDHKQAP